MNGTPVYKGRFLFWCQLICVIAMAREGFEPLLSDKHGGYTCLICLANHGQCQGSRYSVHESPCGAETASADFHVLSRTLVPASAYLKKNSGYLPEFLLFLFSE